MTQASLKLYSPNYCTVFVQNTFIYKILAKELFTMTKIIENIPIKLKVTMQ